MVSIRIPRHKLASRVPLYHKYMSESTLALLSSSHLLSYPKLLQLVGSPLPPATHTTQVTHTSYVFMFPSNPAALSRFALFVLISHCLPHLCSAPASLGVRFTLLAMLRLLLSLSALDSSKCLCMCPPSLSSIVQPFPFTSP